VLERWADADDDRIVSNIERLIADTVDNEINLDTFCKDVSFSFIFCVHV
jgi:hypothetical protein